MKRSVVLFGTLALFLSIGLIALGGRTSLTSNQQDIALPGSSLAHHNGHYATVLTSPPHVIEPATVQHQDNLPKTRQPAIHSSANAATLLLQASTISTMHSKKHPSCLGEDALRQAAIKDQSFEDHLKKYARPTHNCFKNCGGELLPGEPRLEPPHLTIQNVLFHKGKLYTIRDDSTSASSLNAKFGAYFPMVSGEWPQPVVSSIAMGSVNREEALRMMRDGILGEGGVDVVDVGYYQAPTDFLSVYHTTVETVLPMFHRLLDRVAPTHCSAYTGVPAAPTRVLTHRPTTSKWGFKKGSCHIPPANISTMLQSGDLRQNPCLSTVWGKMYTSAAGGVANVFGLQAADHQLNADSLAQSSISKAHRQHLKKKGSTPRDTMFFRSFRLGNPTHCEPLWGPDPFYAEALARDQNLNITATMGAWLSRHNQVAFSSNVKSSSEKKKGDEAGDDAAVMKEFREAYNDCQDLLWRFRSFHIAAANREGDATVSDATIRSLSETFARPIDSSEPIEVVLASRKGDWARQLTTEDKLVDALRKHLATRYAMNKDAVRVLKFGGPLKRQIGMLSKTTIYIANHGANILPSVFLRPNSGVITLSFAEPGFYPFGQFPSWLHWRNMKIEMDCNRQLFKGKCKWSTPNNNHMRMTDEQIQDLLVAVDDIIAAQRGGGGGGGGQQRKTARHNIMDCPSP